MNTQGSAVVCLSTDYVNERWISAAPRNLQQASQLLFRLIFLLNDLSIQINSHFLQLYSEVVQSFSISGWWINKLSIWWLKLGKLSYLIKTLQNLLGPIYGFSGNRIYFLTRSQLYRTLSHTIIIKYIEVWSCNVTRS